MLKETSTKSVLAIKINIALEIISIAPFQLTKEKAPVTSIRFQNFAQKITFQFKISLLITLKFKEVMKENKEGKHLSSSRF